MTIPRQFSLETLRQAVTLTPRGPSDPPEEKPPVGPPVGFPPQGQHVIRWFVDPEGEYRREVKVHHVGSRLRTHCPDFLRSQHPQADYPTCAICRLARQRHAWKLEAKFIYMHYGLLLETDNVQKYWQPGQSYVIAGRLPLKRALDGLVQILLDKKTEAVEALFNPHIPGYATRVSVRQGTQGSPVTIRPLFNKLLPPMELGDWYIPLAEYWLPEACSLDDYEAVLAAFTNGRF
jgi:hypothetical protein